MTASISPDAIKAAQAQLEAHLKEIIQWHFVETGCPFWLEGQRRTSTPQGNPFLRR
jgi:hypothetical protein